MRLGAGEPLALLHYQGGDARSWEPLFDALAAHHELYAIAFPGYGSSPLLDEPPTFAALARAVTRFMAAQGHDTFHVAGISLGGGTALEVGRLGAARSVCAISPAGFAEGWESRYLDATIAAYGLLARAATPVTEPLSRSALARAAGAAQMSVHPTRWPPAYYAATLRSIATSPGYELTRRHALPQRIRSGHEITCPVTIAWGEHDRLLLTGRQAPRARRELPHAHYVPLPGAGHIPLFDAPGPTTQAVLTTTAPAA